MTLRLIVDKKRRIYSFYTHIPEDITGLRLAEFCRVKNYKFYTDDNHKGHNVSKDDEQKIIHQASFDIRDISNYDKTETLSFDFDNFHSSY